MGEIVKFGRGKGNIKGVGKNITWEMGINILFPLILRMLGRREMVIANSGKKIGVGKNIKLYETKYIPGKIVKGRAKGTS